MFTPRSVTPQTEIRLVKFIVLVCEDTDQGLEKIIQGKFRM